MGSEIGCYVKGSDHPCCPASGPVQEKELIRRLSDACWKADQRLEHDSRLALEKVGWTETDLEELEKNARATRYPRSSAKPQEAPSK